jgi:hypothetical protein
MARLFWVWRNVQQVISISSDLKVKTPTLIDPGLPDVASFVVLFGS